MYNVESKIELQQYIVSWTGVIDNAADAVIYEIDTNNDGNYDNSLNLPPIFQDIISPTTTYSYSGELTPNTTGSYIETVTIELQAIDNEGGSGIDTIYYSLDNDAIDLIYLPYTEPIIINGEGDYTLSYYSVDKFGNIEIVNIQNFILTKRPETYAGNISGYVYDDSNENGIQDDGEKTMAGWKIFIDQNGDGYCQENSEPFVITNNKGYYEFDSLVTGIYHIQEIPHQNWIITNPTEGYYNIDLLNGEVITNRNFGNLKTKEK